MKEELVSNEARQLGRAKAPLRSALARRSRRAAIGRGLARDVRYAHLPRTVTS